MPCNYSHKKGYGGDQCLYNCNRMAGITLQEITAAFEGVISDMSDPEVQRKRIEVLGLHL